MRQNLKHLALALAVALSVACDGHDHDHDHASVGGTTGAHAHAGTAAGTHAGSEALTCGTPVEPPTEAQLMAMGGGYHVMASDLNPSTPAKGLNAFTLSVRDEAGAPLSGLTLTVEPFMPAHGHGTSPATFTAAAVEGAEGAYRFEGVNLIMGGLWELRLSVSAEGADPVGLTLLVCVAP